MAEVKVTPIELRLSQKGGTEIASLVRATIDEQARDGISATGAPFLPGKSGPVDLHASGRLFDDVTESFLSLNFNAPYAEDVDRIWHFAGVAPQYLPALETKVKEVLERELEAVER